MWGLNWAHNGHRNKENNDLQPVYLNVCFPFLTENTAHVKANFLLWTELIIRNLNYNSHKNGAYNIDLLRLIRFCARESFLCVNWAFNSNTTESNFEIASGGLSPAPALRQGHCSLQSIKVRTACAWHANCHFIFSGFHLKLVLIGVIALSTVCVWERDLHLECCKMHCSSGCTKESSVYWFT